jgi:hypothetical protein
MPIALVRSFSPPNLKIYTTISVLLVSLCFYYAFETVRNPDWLQNRYNSSQLTSRSIFLKSSSDVISVLSKNDILSSLSSSSSSENSDSLIYNDEIENKNVSRSMMKHLQDVLIFMSHEPICIWVRLRIFLNKRLRITTQGSSWPKLITNYILNLNLEFYFFLKLK